MKTTKLASGKIAHVLILAASFVCLGLPVNAAAAKEHIGKSHGHEHEFYALQNVGEAADHTSPHHASCFMTSSPAEAARGIRHWTGAC